MKLSVVSLRKHLGEIPLSAEHSKQYVKDRPGTGFQRRENLIVSRFATLD